MAGYLALRSMEKNGSAMQGVGGAAGDEEALFKQDLLNAVKTGDEEKLRYVLEHLPAKAVNHVFPEPVSATALHVATQNNSLELVKALLEVAADTGVRDLKGRKFCPLHHAAQNGNIEILEALLKAGADPNAKEGEFDRTSLHILAVHWKKNEDSYKACLDALLSCKTIKVDVLDNSKVSPLFMAATKGWEYMVRKMINKGADINTVVGNKTAADVIKKKFNNLLDTIDFSAIEKQKRYFSDELYDALMNKDLQLFQEILIEIDNTEKTSKVSALEEHHGQYSTLLQNASDNGLTDFVEELLRNGAHPASIDQTNLMSPVLYAARNGYHKILEMLLKALEEQKEIHKGVLRHKDDRKETALHKVVKKEYTVKNGVDYYRCLELLLEKTRHLDLNAQEEFGNTALHYAVLCDDQTFVRILLLNGAQLGIKNEFGTLAITRIQPSVLEEVLNKCIECNHKVSDQDLEIILHYSMLAPAQISQQSETECLRFLSGSRKHRHLLRHPIIDTFLSLKWQRIQNYYYFNLFAYIIFLILLTSYIIYYHGTFMPSTQNGVDSEAQRLNLSSENKEDVQEMEINVVGKYVFKASIFIITLYIAACEVVQIYVSWKLYIKKGWENLLEISIVVLTSILLFLPMGAVHQQSICGWLILFSWIELVLLLGRLPLCSVYITMYTTVTRNFLKFIFMFSPMIIAFSISFYLVFQVNESFTTYYQSLLKTIAMTTGEIEYTDLPLSAFPVSSHVLFVVFVFIIVLVLMNLLNGLAVSDIQQIQQEAEIVSYSSRVELVSYIESVFLASPLHQICPESFRCCEDGEKDDCYFKTCSELYNPVTKFLNWLGRPTLMFQTCLSNPQISMFPNRRERRWYVCKCHNFRLKEAQIEAAKDVVLEKKYAVDTRRLSGLENRLDEVMAAISSLANKVDKHVLCPSPE